MSTTTDTVQGTMPAAPRQIVPPEELYADELAFLAAHDSGPRPPGWRLTPRAVVTFVMGADEPLRLPEGADPGEGVPRPARRPAEVRR